MYSLTHQDWALTHALRAGIAAVGLSEESIPIYEFEYGQLMGVLKQAEAMQLDALAALGLSCLGADEKVVQAKERSEKAFLRSMLLQHQRDRLEKELHKLDTPHVFLKGILSDNLWWKQTGLRGASDIDLLVHPNDQAKVGALLNEMGFTHLTGERSAFIRPHFSSVYCLSFGSNDFMLDVHYRLIDRGYHFETMTRNFFGTRKRYQTAYGPIWGLAEEESLLFMAVNTALNAYDGRYKIALDAVCLLRNGHYCPLRLVELAKTYGLEGALWTLLTFVQTRFGVSLPVSLLNGMQVKPRTRQFGPMIAGRDRHPQHMGGLFSRLVFEDNKVVALSSFSTALVDRLFQRAIGSFRGNKE